MQKPKLLKRTTDYALVSFFPIQIIVTKHHLHSGKSLVKVRRVSGIVKLLYRIELQLGVEDIFNSIVDSLLSGTVGPSDFSPLVYAIGGTAPGANVIMPTPPALIVH